MMTLLKKWLRIFPLCFILALMLPFRVQAANLSYGSTGSSVYTLQSNLWGLGYGKNPDGIFGKNTRSALIWYQSDRGLSPDGIAGEKTLTRIGEDVQKVQSALKELGFLSGKVDGIYGTDTKAAVQSFQRQKGISADGIAGSITQSYLFSNTGGLKKLMQQAKNWGSPLKVSYLSITGGRSFGYQRSDGRQHAGIDYYVENGAGTPVYAVTSGTVTNISRTFYAGTGAVTVLADEGSVIRYGEITPTVAQGKWVEKGTQIGYITANQADGGTMLHLELYSGAASGSLTKEGNTYWYLSGKYNRREDLLDPTWFGLG